MAKKFDMETEIGVEETGLQIYHQIEEKIQHDNWRHIGLLHVIYPVG